MSEDGHRPQRLQEFVGRRLLGQPRTLGSPTPGRPVTSPLWSGEGVSSVHHRARLGALSYCRGALRVQGFSLVFSGVTMGEYLYLYAALIGLVWLIWFVTSFRNRESTRLAREVDERLKISTELLNTLPGTLRR